LDTTRWSVRGSSGRLGSQRYAYPVHSRGLLRVRLGEQLLTALLPTVIEELITAVCHVNEQCAHDPVEAITGS
jgi:hypothetical protein